MNPITKDSLFPGNRSLIDYASTNCFASSSSVLNVLGSYFILIQKTNNCRQAQRFLSAPFHTTRFVQCSIRQEWKKYLKTGHSWIIWQEKPNEYEILQSFQGLFKLRWGPKLNKIELKTLFNSLDQQDTKTVAKMLGHLPLQMDKIDLMEFMLMKHSSDPYEYTESYRWKPQLISTSFIQHWSNRRIFY